MENGETKRTNFARYKKISRVGGERVLTFSGKIYASDKSWYLTFF